MKKLSICELRIFIGIYGLFKLKVLILKFAKVHKEWAQIYKKLTPIMLDDPSPSQVLEPVDE